MARCQIAFAMTMAAAWFSGAPALAIVLDVSPNATVGVTDNALAASSDQVTRDTNEYVAVGAFARLQLTRPRAVHRLGYGFHLVRFSSTTSANSTAHDLAWDSNFTPSARATLMLGAAASLYDYSAITAAYPGMSVPTAVPIATGPSEVLNTSANETFDYQPNGRQKFAEVLTLNHLEPVGGTNTVPESLAANLSLRGERLSGVTAYTLTLGLGQFSFLGAPAQGSNRLGAGDVTTVELLGGWQRQLSAVSTVEVQAGALGFYGTGTGTFAVGPAFAATAGYRHLPWFATLSLSQQPMVNIYIGQAFIADAATARVVLPLNKRETLMISGLAGYTYARAITGSQHFIFAPRAYDLFLLVGSVVYQFTRLPLAVSLDYTVISQRGSVTELPNGGLATSYPSTLQRYLGLTLRGSFRVGDASPPLAPPAPQR